MSEALAAALFVALVAALAARAGGCHCRDRERTTRQGRRHRWPGELAELLGAELRHTARGMAAVVAAAYVDTRVLDVVTWRFLPPHSDASGADLVVVLRVPLLLRPAEVRRLRADAARRVARAAPCASRALVEVRRWPLPV